MSSFYGGMPGRSFVIKAHFDSVADMYNSFMKGPDYTDVWYGEHCIISTPNKNNPDNGKVFLRGVNYTYKNEKGESTGDAKFVGQIVGPSSGTPWFEMGGFDLLEKRRTQALDLEIGQERLYPIKNEDSDIQEDYVSYHDTDNEGTDPDLYTFEFNTENGALIPGKTLDSEGNPVYNNAIKYSWVNIRSAYEDNDSWVYMGFQIPYPVVDFETESLYPYNNKHEYEVDSSAQEIAVDGALFYKKYKIKIPQGVKGDSITGFRKHVVAKDDVIYSLDDVSYTDAHELGKTSVLTVAEQSTYDVEANIGKTVLLYDIETYVWTDKPEFTEKQATDEDTEILDEPETAPVRDKNIQPDKITVYITDYDQIEKAYVSDDGTFSFFTNNNTRIDLIMVDGAGNPLYEYEQAVDINGNPIYDEDGNPVYKTEDGQPVYQEKPLLDSDGNPVLDENNNPLYEKVPKKFRIKFIENIKLSKDFELEEDKRISVKYNTAPHPVKIGDPINYVQEIVIDKRNYHLYILFNDKTHRFENPPADATEEELSKKGIVKESNDCYIENGIRWVRRINLTEASKEIQTLLGWQGVKEDGSFDYGDKNEIADSIFWRDYCTVKDQAGVLIGLNKTYNEMKAIMDKYGIEVTDPSDDEKIIEALNKEYKEGLDPNNVGDGSLKGKIISVGEDPYDKRMYAFNYEKDSDGKYKGWFYLGKTNENDLFDAKLLIKDDSINDMSTHPFVKDDYANVTVKGLIFIAEDSQAKPEGLPRFWDPSYDGFNNAEDYRWYWMYIYEDGSSSYEEPTE